MKKIIKMTFVAAFAAIAGYGIYANQKGNAMSDLALANVEALAEGESSEDFTQHTGCIAVWDNVNCRGDDGRLYSYARRP